MATYPIKVLRDEDKKPFVPLVNAGAIVSNDGSTLEEKLENKLEASNIIEGSNINIEKNGNNCTISANLPSGLNVVNNLTTESPGLGVLDAHQGKILKDSIPKVVNDLTTISDKESLSAYQGYLLNLRSAPAGGKNGQVLKKSNDNDYQFEWGDAADPNAISGDGSITKIINLDYEEYKNLESQGKIDPNTEYHINSTTAQNYSLVEDNLTSNSKSNSLSANQGRVLNEKITKIVETDSNILGSWCKFENGVLIQSGQGRCAANVGYVEITFPLSFLDTTYTMTASHVYTGGKEYGGSGQLINITSPQPNRKDGAYIYSYKPDLSISSYPRNVSYIAMGKWK